MTSNTLNSTPEEWSNVLREPLKVGNRSVRYRYPNQKAKFLADAMRAIGAGQISTEGGRQLRDSLLKIRGVGPKTAGWVARNYLDSDDVAILDIHIIRAGLLCDLFKPEQKVEKHYFEMESKYIAMCLAMNVRPAVLDCLIWDQMRILGQFAINAVRYKLGQLPDEAPASRTTQIQLNLAH